MAQPTERIYESQLIGSVLNDLDNIEPKIQKQRIPVDNNHEASRKNQQSYNGLDLRPNSAPPYAQIYQVCDF